MPSPTGAARAENDDDDTTNNASRSKEQDGNLMKNDSSGKNLGRGIGFSSSIANFICDIKVSSLIMNGLVDIGLVRTESQLDLSRISISHIFPLWARCRYLYI